MYPDVSRAPIFIPPFISPRIICFLIIRVYIRAIILYNAGDNSLKKQHEIRKIQKKEHIVIHIWCISNAGIDRDQS